MKWPSSVNYSPPHIENRIMAIVLYRNVVIVRASVLALDHSFILSTRQFSIENSQQPHINNKQSKCLKIPSENHLYWLQAHFFFYHSKIGLLHSDENELLIYYTVHLFSYDLYFVGTFHLGSVCHHTYLILYTHSIGPIYSL